MRKLKSISLLGITTSLVLALSSCAILSDKFTLQEFEKVGGIHAVLTSNNVKFDNSTKEHYKTAIKVIDYRLDRYVYKRNLTLDDSGNISLDVIYNKDVDDSLSFMEDSIAYFTQVGAFTIQETDIGKRNSMGDYMPTGRILVDSTDIKNAVAKQENGEIFLEIELTDNATKVFEEATEKLVGRPLGIFMDNTMLAAPDVGEKITNGFIRLFLRKDKEETMKILTMIKSGPLPFKLEGEIKSIPAKKK